MTPQTPTTPLPPSQTESVQHGRSPLSLEHARTYSEWLGAARRHDQRTGASHWRRTTRSRRYDYKVIQKRLDELRAAKASGDIQAVLYYLNEGIHGNMGGMGNARMYNRALSGTKDLVTNYIREQAEAIEMVAAAAEADISRAAKRDFLQRASLCFGRTALMLSGGGALGPFHIGVARALFSQGLLPSVISGSSAGSFVAAILGTHTDAELAPQLTADTPLEAPRMDAGGQQVGARITIDDVRNTLAREVPDLTFAEAFERTGRRINITVSPSEFHQSSRLLNAVTSPNVFVHEAVLASTAVPGVFDPVTLMARNYRGERQPYVPSRKWADGSVSDDLPAKRLARLYGVNYFITSQINPAVLWAVNDADWDESLPSRLWEVYQSASREYLRATFPFAMALTRNTYPLNVLTRMLYSVALQDCTADINIIPRRRLWEPSKLLAVWSEKETLDLIRDGEMQTWPKMEMIRNCTLIGRTLERLSTEFDVAAP